MLCLALPCLSTPYPSLLSHPCWPSNIRHSILIISSGPMQVPLSSCCCTGTCSYIYAIPLLHLIRLELEVACKQQHCKSECIGAVECMGPPLNNTPSIHVTTKARRCTSKTPPGVRHGRLAWARVGTGSDLHQQAAHEQPQQLAPAHGSVGSANRGHPRSEPRRPARRNLPVASARALAAQQHGP